MFNGAKILLLNFNYCLFRIGLDFYVFKWILHGRVVSALGCHSDFNPDMDAHIFFVNYFDPQVVAANQVCFLKYAFLPFITFFLVKKGKMMQTLAKNATPKSSFSTM